MASKLAQVFDYFSPPPATVASRLVVMIPTERQVINMSSVRQLLAVQTFGISASNLPKMAPKLALSLGACPSSGRRLLPLSLPLTLTLPLHTGGA